MNRRVSDDCCVDETRERRGEATSTARRGGARSRVCRVGFDLPRHPGHGGTDARPPRLGHACARRRRARGGWSGGVAGLAATARDPCPVRRMRGDRSPDAGRRPRPGGHRRGPWGPFRIDGPSGGSGATLGRVHQSVCRRPPAGHVGSRGDPGLRRRGGTRGRPWREWLGPHGRAADRCRGQHGVGLRIVAPTTVAAAGRPVRSRRLRNARRRHRPEHPRRSEGANTSSPGPTPRAHGWPGRTCFSSDRSWR